MWWHQKVGIWPVQCIATIRVSRYISGVWWYPHCPRTQGWACWGPLHCCLVWKELDHPPYSFLRNFLISFTFSILDTVDLDLYSYLRLTERIASILPESICKFIFCWLYQHIRSSTKKYFAVATRSLLKWAFIRSQASTSQTSTTVLF